MQHDISLYLFDISGSIDSIFDYLGPERNFNQFDRNKLVRRAIERELEIIGEAVNRILKIDPNFQIPDARRIVSLRNLVIHAYDNVDNIILWGIINNDLPALQRTVQQLLEGFR